MADNEIYWSESDVGKSAFSFDDADDNVGSTMCGVSLEGTTKLFQEMRRDGLTDDSSYPITDVRDKIPLCKLISERLLNKFFEFDNDTDPAITNRTNLSASEEVKILRRQVMDRWIAPDVNNMVTRIMLGQPYSLELYKTLEQKKSLLNASINSGDGDTILTVLLFLMKTLKKGIFNRLLMNNPIAANHYVDYLSTRMQVQELTDILTMLSRNKDASMKQFELACRNPQRQMSRLNNCLQNHFNPVDNDRFHIEKFIKLLEWQLSAKIIREGIIIGDLSVIDCLSFACEHHWSDPLNSLSPYSLVQQHSVNDKQFQWTVLQVRGKLNAWQDINNFFITKKWLGGSKLKASIPMEQVVLQLHSLNCPPDMLIQYISLIDNLEQRISIARTVKCHKAVIDIFTTQRDRQSLICYKDCYLIPGSEEYTYAENKLQSLSIKWRN